MNQLHLPDRSTRPVARAVRWAAAVLAVAALSAAVAALVLVAPPAADFGEPAAGLAGVRELLARYDRSHDDRALLEASRWFDRQWEAGDEGAFAIAQALRERECAHRLLQWHWLCESGE